MPTIPIPGNPCARCCLCGQFYVFAAQPLDANGDPSSEQCGITCNNIGPSLGYEIPNNPPQQFQPYSFYMLSATGFCTWRCRGLDPFPSHSVLLSFNKTAGIGLTISDTAFGSFFAVYHKPPPFNCEEANVLTLLSTNILCFAQNVPAFLVSPYG